MMKWRWIGSVAAMVATLAAAAFVTLGRKTEPLPASSQTAPFSSIQPIKGKADEVSGRIFLPLDVYGISVRESRVMNLAINMLVADCMKTRGFMADVVDRVDEPLPADRRYGIWHLGEARKYGYGVLPASPAQQREEALNRRTMSPAEAAQFARCNKAPEVRALAIIPLSAQRAAQSTYVSALQSAPGRSAIADWQACLTARGVQPDVQPDRLWFPIGALPPDTERSRAIALVDVACKAKVRLVDRLVEIESQLQKLLLYREGPALVAERRKISHVVAEAQKIIAHADR